MSAIRSESVSAAGRHFVVLDSGEAFRTQLGRDRTTLVSRLDELRNALAHSPRGSVWILTGSKWVERLIKEALGYTRGLQRKEFGDLVMLQPAQRNELLPPLRSYFATVIGEYSFSKMLPREQLAEALASNESNDRFIAGIVDEDLGTLTLWRGNLEAVIVPLSIFKPGGPTKPDFKKFELDDYGYTIKFGPYEASAHHVLSHVDPDYRRRYNQKRLAEERGFGPALRRLRILKRMARDDFAGVSAKTIARIERGETGKPQGRTLAKIARALGVAPDEIETY